MRIFCILMAIWLSVGQLLDVPGTQKLIIPDWNRLGFNGTGRYSQILFFAPWTGSMWSKSYFFESEQIFKSAASSFYWIGGEYDYLLGPLVVMSKDEFIDQCTFGIENILMNDSDPRVRSSWNDGRFCLDYLCDRNSGLFEKYRYNVTMDANSSAIHSSLLNMCMLCTNTMNQSSFIEQFVSQKCIPSLPKHHCLDSAKTLTVYNNFSGSVCYDWSYRRYYGRADNIHLVLLRVYLFYGNWVTFLVNLPLLIVSIVLVVIPAIGFTMSELDRTSMTRQRFGWLRIVFSLYNQSVGLLVMGELMLVVFSFLDLFAIVKMYPYILFLDQIMVLSCFINIISILY